MSSPIVTFTLPEAELLEQMEQIVADGRRLERELQRRIDMMIWSSKPEMLTARSQLEFLLFNLRLQLADRAQGIDVVRRSMETRAQLQASAPGSEWPS